MGCHYTAGGIANTLWVGWSWVRMSVGARYFYNPQSLLFDGHLGSFSGVKLVGREFKHLLLVQRLRISAAVPPLPPSPIFLHVLDKENFTSPVLSRHWVIVLSVSRECFGLMFNERWWAFWPLKMRKLGCLERSGTNHSVTWRHILGGGGNWYLVHISAET